MAYRTIKYPHLGNQVLNFAAETNYGIVPAVPTWKGLHLIGGGFKGSEVNAPARMYSALAGGSHCLTKTLTQGLDVSATYETPLVKADLTDLFTLFERAGSPLALSSFVIDHLIRDEVGDEYGDRYTGMKVDTARISGNNPGEIILALDLVGRKRTKIDSATAQETVSAIDPYLMWSFGAFVDDVWWHDPESFEISVGHSLAKGPYRTSDKGISSLEECAQVVTASLTGVFSQESLRDLVATDTLFDLKLKFDEGVTDDADGAPQYDAGSLVIQLYKCRVTEHPVDTDPEGFVSGTVQIEAESDSGNDYANWTKTLPS